MGILDQIANPQMANIVAALDVREKRALEAEQHRKDIKMGQLIAEATPNLRKDSPLYQMALNSPKEYMVFSKAMGIPLNAGDQMQQMANDVNDLYMSAQNGGPQGAIDRAAQIKADRNKSGIETPQLDKWLESVNTDPQTALTSLFVMHRSINETPMTENQKAQAELEKRKLDLEGRKLDLMGSQGVKEDTTAQQKNWKEYQRLLAIDPAQAEKFAQSAGISAKDNEKLSSYVEKQIATSSDLSNAAMAAASKYNSLADSLIKSKASGGIKGKVSEYIKEQTGGQDDITALKQQALQIVNSEAIQNLPPGPATDRDIEMVRAPFPTDKASPEYIANWLKAMARLQDKKSEYEEFKANFLAENKTTRTKGGQSLLASWKESQKSELVKRDQTDAVTEDKKGGQLMIDAKGNKAIVYPDGTFKEVP